MNPRKKIAERAILARIYCEGDPDSAHKFIGEINSRLDFLTRENNQTRLVNLDFRNVLIVEILLNDHLNNDAFWIDATRKIQQTIVDFEEDIKINILGTTWIYQANLPTGIALNSLNISDLLKEENLIYHESPLSQEISGGRLWLLDFPVFGYENSDNWKKDMMLLALSPQVREDKLKEFLHDRSFVYQDLLVHKALQCGWNYRRMIIHGKFDSLLEQIAKSTKSVLQENDVLKTEKSLRLRNLSNDFDKLLEYTPDLAFQKAAIGQHAWEFRRLFNVAPEKRINKFLYEQIISFQQEIILKCEQCDRVLASAKQVVDIIRTRIEQIKENRRQKQQIILAILAAVLAVPQLFTSGTIKGIFSSLWDVALCDLQTLGVQITLIVIFTLLILLVMAFINWIVRKRN